MKTPKMRPRPRIPVLLLTTLLALTYISTSAHATTTESLWTFQASDGTSFLTSVPDVDGNGWRDIIVATTDGKVFCIDGGSGREIWMGSSGVLPTSMDAKSDLNGDQKNDVVLSNLDGVYALSGADGAELWRHPSGDVVSSVATIQDVTGDGRPDVIAGTVGGSWRLAVLRGVDGREVWRALSDEMIFGVNYIPDITGDGRPEVVAITLSSNGVFCLNGVTGTIVWSRPVSTWCTSLNVVRADSGGYNLVVGATGDANYTLELVNSATGASLWHSRNIPDLVDPVIGIPVSSEANPREDILAYGGRTLYRIDSRTGAQIWNATAPPPVSIAVIPDVTNDGIPDVLLGSDSILHLLNGTTGREILHYIVPASIGSVAHLPYATGSSQLAILGSGGSDNKVYAVWGSIDASAPEITILGPENGTTLSENPANFKVRVQDGESGIKRAQISIEGSWLDMSYDPASSSWILNRSLPDNTYVWRIRAENNFGLTSTSGSYILTVNAAETAFNNAIQPYLIPAIALSAVALILAVFGLVRGRKACLNGVTRVT